MVIKRSCIVLTALALGASALPAQEETGRDTAREATGQDTAVADTAVADTMAAETGPVVTAERPIPPGLYHFVPEESEKIDQKVREAVDHIFFAIRGIARRRLAGANEPIDRIFLDYAGDTLVVSLRSDEPTVETLMNGEPIPYTRADGEVVQVSADVKPGVVDMRFVAEDGEKQMIYTLREDGLLAVESITYSDKLEEPFRYTWVYEPASSAPGSD